MHTYCMHDVHICALLYVATKAPCTGEYFPSPELKIAGGWQGTDLSSEPFGSPKDRFTSFQASWPVAGSTTHRSPQETFSQCPEGAKAAADKPRENRRPSCTEFSPCHLCS